MKELFIQQAALLVGLGILVEGISTYVYYTPEHTIEATKDLLWWWIDGQYVEYPIAWAVVEC
jgi:hypothetical protein